MSEPIDESENSRLEQSDDFDLQSRAHSTQHSSPLSPATSGLDEGSERTKVVKPDKYKRPTRMPVDLEPAQREDSIGRLGHYEILNIVGYGGMGVVARAFDEQLHRNVAIKVMSERLTTSERAQKRFLREARAAASVNHPNVVTIHAVAEKDGAPYLVMEFVEGQTLTDRITQDSPMGYEDVLRIGAQIASGLAAAHRHGIIHRDIKPGNVMLEDNIERVKLSDFGLARLLVENSDLTSLGDMVGTPSYMSPEQVEGEELTEASDLFSLGCVLYAMFHGRSPFHAGSSYASAARVRSFAPPPVSSFIDGIPPEFDQLMTTLLAKNPKGRPKSAQQVADLLLSWSAHSHQQRLTSFHLPVPLPRRSLSSVLHSDRWLRSFSAVLLVLACLAIGLAGWKWNQGDSPGNTSSTSPISLSEDPLEDGIINVDLIGGEVSSLREAIALATPGTTIRIGPGTHQGPFDITDRERLEGLKLIGSSGARLEGPLASPVVRVVDVANVTIDGLTISASDVQMGLHVSGNCPGLVVQNSQLQAKSTESHGCELVRFDFGASGTDESPMQIHHCEFDAGAVGIVVGSHDVSEAPVQHVLVHQNHLRNDESHYGIPMVIQGQVRSVLVERNWMSQGEAGFSFRFPVAQCAQQINVRYNTFADVDIAMFLNDSELDQDVRFDDNLIADATTCQTISGNVDRYFQWCAENQWVETRSILQPAIREYFTIMKPDEFKSLDKDSPDYLVPIESKSKNISGVYAQAR
ncbi:serine/threonine protein kinase [Stieleria sp. JC731]|uniref:serine/threonine-protein kinase n=1 Tax=Pirellulaceae TaxID=2691357 RepID=UPI001E440AD0|nr:serine/threonine-protein kinase [Stieleria sp. JC731]MCC9602337.1 serine/threonine protein kinase [Stieleria sp. JC731]